MDQTKWICTRGYASSLRVISAKFLPDGFVMDWETSHPVYPTTLLEPIHLSPSSPPPPSRSSRRGIGRPRKRPIGEVRVTRSMSRASDTSGSLNDEVRSRESSRSLSRAFGSHASALSQVPPSLKPRPIPSYVPPTSQPLHWPVTLASADPPVSLVQLSPSTYRISAEVQPEAWADLLVDSDCSADEDTVEQLIIPSTGQTDKELEPDGHTSNSDDDMYMSWSDYEKQRLGAKSPVLSSSSRLPPDEVIVVEDSPPVNPTHAEHSVSSSTDTDRRSAHALQPDTIVRCTNDAAERQSKTLRRRCFACQSTEQTVWRRSKLNPGKILCDRCGCRERYMKRQRTKLEALPLRSNEEEHSIQDVSMHSNVASNGNNSGSSRRTADLENHAVNFLLEYMVAFNSGRSLDDAYSSLATYSERIISNSPPTNKLAPCQIGDSGIRIPLALKRLREHYGFHFGFPIVYDLVVLPNMIVNDSTTNDHAECGVMLMCCMGDAEQPGAIPSAVGCEMSFILRLKDWHDCDRLRPTSGPLVALCHQITLRLHTRTMG